MNLLEDYYQSYLRCAKILPNFKEGKKNSCNDITELANGYCDADEAGNELLKSAYFSALMIRYWYMTGYLMKSCGDSKVEPEDALNWVTDGLMIGFSYRRWRDKKNKLYKDKHGPEKVFHKAMETMKLRWFTYNNRLNRRINQITYSLDESLDIHGDLAEGCAIEDDFNKDLSVNLLISTLLKKHKIFEALVVDNICFGDTWSSSKSVTSVFSNQKLYKSLVNIDVKYLNYFVKKYNIKDIEEIIIVVNRVKTMPTRNAYKKIQLSIDYFRKQEERAYAY